MTLPKTRLIVSAVVFAANMMLSLSYGTAAAQAPRPGTSQMSHHMPRAARVAVAIEARAMAMKPGTSMTPGSDYPGFCGFSGPNAC